MRRFGGLAIHQDEQEREGDARRSDGPSGVMVNDAGDDEGGDGEPGGSRDEDVDARRTQEESNAGGEDEDTSNRADGPDAEWPGQTLQNATKDEFLDSASSFEGAENDGEESEGCLRRHESASIHLL